MTAKNDSVPMARFALHRLHAPLRTVTLLLLQSLAACSQESKTDAVSDAKPKASQRQPVPTEIWMAFSGPLAYAEVEKQVAFGPRPAGSQALSKARAHLSSTLQANGWNVEPQGFVAQTPHGALQMINLVARFGTPGTAQTTTQKAIIGSHYDTKSFSTISFVGANDGASSTGALLELSRVLALDPVLAAQIELVFFDGEEALQQFTETDGLYGSRHYATQLRDSGRAAQFKFAVVWDMIGDRNLTVTLPLDSPKDLTQGLLASAEALQSRGAFRIFDRPMLDDHVPINLIARIPAIDIIDFEYDAWHTADDTLAQISADSLQTIGCVTLHFLKKLLP